MRQFGDGNPGSANAFKAGGWACGIFALLLDYLKGCLPVLLANSYLSIDKVWIILIAIAPILGHAFSPFLGFKGGKAIATTFGVWTGLTLYKAPLVLGGFCAFFLYILKSSAWATVFAFITFLVVYLFFEPNFFLMVIGLINLVIILLKHHPELKRPILLRTH